MIDNVILLNSEITKGMKSYGPKAFVPINKTPLVVKQIENILQTYGKKTNIYVVMGFEYDKFNSLIDHYFSGSKYNNIHKIFNTDFENTNNSHAAFLAINDIMHGGTIIVQNGILLIDYIPKYQNKSILPIINTKNLIFNLGMNISNNRVQYMFYDLDNKWSEIIYISPDDLKKIKLILSKSCIRQQFLFETVNLLIENNIMFETEIISSKKIIKINNHKDKV